jgi:hypothetical protein
VRRKIDVTAPFTMRLLHTLRLWQSLQASFWQDQMAQTLLGLADQMRAGVSKQGESLRLRSPYRTPNQRAPRSPSRRRSALALWQSWASSDAAFRGR